MRKISPVFVAVVLVIFQSSIVFSDEPQKGIVKSVDVRTATLVFVSDGGKEITLKADKSVELGNIKAGDKAEISVENDMLKSIKPGHVNWCPKDF